jgi:drug/metabolite transporter (DMT)-like permease
VTGFAVAAAAGYGAADFAGGIATRRQPTTATLILTQPTALCVLLTVTLFTGPPADTGALAWGALAGVTLLAGVALVYRCFSTGAISVAAAVFGVVSAAVPAVAGVALGAAVRVGAVAGLVVAVAAILLLRADDDRPAVDQARARSIEWVVANRQPNRRPLGPAVTAAGAGAAFGLYHVLMSRTGASSGLWPLLTAQYVVVVVSAAAWAVHRPRPVWSLVPLCAAAGVIEIGGSFAALAAVRGNVAVAGVVIALAPAVSVLLAWAVLHERVRRRQVSGLVLAAAAVALLAGGAG